MPTYEQLYHLNLGSLKEAVERWAETPIRFKGLLNSFSDHVEKPFNAAGWTGPMMTVQVARMRMSMCHKDFADASVESKGIHGILDDVYTELKKAKDDLHQLADVKAPEQGLYVTASGVVLSRHPESVDPTDAPPPGELGSMTKEESKISALEGEIQAVLDRAAEADEPACWALRKNTGGKTAGAFNDKQVTTSLDSADAQHAAQLMRRGNKMTFQEMNELREIMHRNRKDPEFSTDFYKALGPKNTIETIAKISAQMPSASEPRQELYKDLKKEMGLSLATATDPDNQPHLSDAWNEDLRKAGSERMEPTGGESKISYYGYQALGEILREGKYDPHFLVPVAEHVTQLQVKHPGEIPNTGVLEALGHSPEASTDFFNGPTHAYHEDGSPKDGEPDLGKDAKGKPIKNYLDYLTDPNYKWGQETHPDAPGAIWGDWDEYDKENEAALRKGPDALGHALEAAVSGRPYDDESAAPVKHTEQEASLMHRVVDKFGNHPELISAKGDHILSSMSDSLGNMTADYMLDVQRAMGGDDGSGPQSFPHYGADPDFAKLNQGPLQQFLGEVGKDPHAYGAISQAQQAATTQAVSHVIEADGEHMVAKTGDAVAPGAVIQGILSESRATATYDDKIAEDKEFNEGLTKGDKWAGRIIGMGLKRVPVAGDVVNWAIEDSREAVVKQYTRDSQDAAHQDASAYVEENRENAAKAAQRAALNAAKQSGLSDEEAAAVGTAAYTQANTSYGEGRHRESGIGKG
ncbi:hypothetical protein [Streptomyces lydicus]|uniref:hypothetical protein n=1 Tax=Streptomyces lydicus TaxID=47763 RepID=UPI0037B37E8B